MNKTKHVLVVILALCMPALLHASDQDAVAQKRAEIAARVARAKAQRNKPIIKLTTGITIDDSLEFALQAVAGKTFFVEQWAELFSDKTFTFDQVLNRHPEISHLLTMTDEFELLRYFITLNQPEELPVDQIITELFNAELILRYGRLAKTDLGLRALEGLEYYYFLKLQYALLSNSSLYQRIEESGLYHYYEKYFSAAVSYIAMVNELVNRGNRLAPEAQWRKQIALVKAIETCEKIFSELSRLKEAKKTHTAHAGNASWLAHYKTAHAIFKNALKELQDESLRDMFGKCLGQFRLKAAAYFFPAESDAERMSQKNQTEIVTSVLFDFFYPETMRQINLEALNETQSVSFSCFFYMVIERIIGCQFLPELDYTTGEREKVISHLKTMFVLWNQVINTSANPHIATLKDHWRSIIALGETLVAVCFENKHGKKPLQLTGFNRDALVSAYQDYAKARTLLDQFRHIELEGNEFGDLIEDVSNFIIELTSPECPIEKFRYYRHRLIDYLINFEDESLKQRKKDRQCYKDAVESGNAEIIRRLERAAIDLPRGRILRPFIEFSYQQEAAVAFASIERLHKEGCATAEGIQGLIASARSGHIVWNSLSVFCTAPYYQDIPYEELIAKAGASELQLRSLYAHLATQICASGNDKEQIANFNDKHLSTQYLSREQKLKLVLSYLKKVLPVLESTDVPQVIERIAAWNQDLGGYKATELHSDVAGAVMTLMDLFIDECLWSSLDRPTIYAHAEKSLAKLAVRLSPDQQEVMRKKKAEIEINRIVVGYNKEQSNGKQKLEIIDHLTRVAEGKEIHAVFHAQLALEALVKEDGSAIANARQEREMEKQRKAKTFVVAKRDLSPIGGKASVITEIVKRVEKKPRSSTPVPHAIAHRAKGVPVKVQEPVISTVQQAHNFVVESADTLEDYMRGLVCASIVAAQFVVKEKKALERNKRREVLRIAKLAAKGKLGAGWIPQELKALIHNEAAPAPDLDTTALVPEAMENLATYLECEKIQESQPAIKQRTASATVPNLSYAQATEKPDASVSSVAFAQTEHEIEQIKELDYELATQQVNDGAFLNNRNLLSIAHYAQLSGGVRSHAQSGFADLLSVTTSIVPEMFCNLSRMEASEATAQYALNYLKSLDQDLLIPVCHDFLHGVFTDKQLHDQMQPDIIRETYLNIAWYLRYCDDRIGAAIQRLETIKLLHELQQPLELLAVGNEACRLKRYEQLVSGYSMMLHTTIINGNIFCQQRICQLLAQWHMDNSCEVIEDVLVPAQRSFLERRLQDLNRIIADGAEPAQAMDTLVAMLEQTPKITAGSLKHKVRFVL